MNPPLPLMERAQALAAEFARHAARHDQDSSFPFEHFDDLHEAGFLTLASPRPYGGQEASLSQLSQIISVLGAADPATALVLVMQYSHHRGMHPKIGAWPSSLALQLVSESLERVSLINALRVEPDLGTPARGGLPETTASLLPDGSWRLNGQKIYSTGSTILSWYLVWAKTDEPSPRTGYFLVSAKYSGIRIAPTWNHLGLRASASHDVFFEQVHLPPEAGFDLRPPEGWFGYDGGLHSDMAVLLGALYTGIARAARNWTFQFLKQRTPSSLGASLASLPRAQEIAGQIDTLLFVNDQLLASAARQIDEGQAPGLVASGQIKSVTTNNAIQAVQEAITLTSNHGLSRHNPLERHLRDVLCGRVHTPQDDSVHLQAGRRALNL